MTITFPLLGNLGRLGNQLWQIASTIGLAHAHNVAPRFPPWAYMRYFSVPEEFFVERPNGIEATALVPHMDERAAGYLQDYGLWVDVAPHIRSYFKPSSLALATLENYEEFAALPRPILGVHVRRGDNVQENDPGTPNKHLYHPMPTVEWYLEAMRALREGTKSVAVFSDDPAWCREHIPADYYHEGTVRPKEHEPAYASAPVLDWIDLFLYSRCQRHVISNSSYAWWGAFLSGDNCPVYPWPWFGPRISYVDAALMFPPLWSRLQR